MSPEEMLEHYEKIYPKLAQRVAEAINGSFAEQLFAALKAQDIMESRFTHELMAMGVLGDCSEYRFDSYDGSFELKGTAPGLELTPEQCAKLAALGFERCWICYTDSTEKYYLLSAAQKDKGETP